MIIKILVAKWVYIILRNTMTQHANACACACPRWVIYIFCSDLSEKLSVWPHGCCSVRNCLTQMQLAAF